MVLMKRMGAPPKHQPIVEDLAAQKTNFS